MQVEVKDNPELAGSPVAIQDAPGGPLLACSSEAQAQDVHCTEGAPLLPNMCSPVSLECPSGAQALPRFVLPQSRGCLKSIVAFWAVCSLIL